MNALGSLADVLVSFLLLFINLRCSLNLNFRNLSRVLGLLKSVLFKLFFVLFHVELSLFGLILHQLLLRLNLGVLQGEPFLLLLVSMLSEGCDVLLYLLTIFKLHSSFRGQAAVYTSLGVLVLALAVSHPNCCAWVTLAQVSEVALRHVDVEVRWNTTITLSAFQIGLQWRQLDGLRGFTSSVEGTRVVHLILLRLYVIIWLVNVQRLLGLISGNLGFAVVTPLQLCLFLQHEN